MKRVICTLLFTFFLSNLFAQQVSSHAPQKPMPNEVITVTYHPDAKQATIKKTDSLMLQALFWPSEGYPVYRRFSMKKTGDSWQTQLQPDSLQPVYIQYKFTSDDLKDDNNGHFWDLPLYNKQGQLLPNTYLRMGDSWNFLSHFEVGLYEPTMIRERTVTNAHSYYRRAWQRSPMDTQAAMLYLKTLSYQIGESEYKEGLKEQGQCQTDRFVSRFSDVSTRPKVLATAVYAYNRFGNKERADSLKAILLDNFYEHDAAELQRYYQIFETKSDSLKINRSQAYLANYPEAEPYDQIVLQHLFPAMIHQGRTEEAFEWLNDHNPDNSLFYGKLAEQMLNNGHSDTALTLNIAQKGYELSLKKRSEKKPTYATSEEWLTAVKWKVQNRKAYGAFTLSRVYAESNQYQKAEPLAKEAVTDREWKEASYNTHYIQLLAQNKRYRKAITEGRKAIVENQAEKELLHTLKQSYRQIHGVEADTEQFIAEAKKESAENLRQELRKQLIRKERPDFNMTSLKGKKISPNQYENKVIVLDFWARWCGPCIAAFPDYQKVVNHFKDNDQVVFWAVNTMDGALNKDRIEGIHEFMDEHELSFPVLLDEGKNAKAFGVRGIPTQIIIGKKGDIRFKEIGYSGTSLKQKMIVMIKMLLKE